MRNMQIVQVIFNDYYCELREARLESGFPLYNISSNKYYSVTTTIFWILT